jgi:hypothetical protein
VEVEIRLFPGDDARLSKNIDLLGFDDLAWRQRFVAIFKGTELNAVEA